MEYYLNELSNHSSSNILVNVVGNKRDLLKENQLPTDSEVEYLRKRVQGVFTMASALNGQGVDDIFKDIVAKLLARTKQENNKRVSEGTKISKANAGAQGPGKLGGGSKKDSCC